MVDVLWDGGGAGRGSLGVIVLGFCGGNSDGGWCGKAAWCKAG